MRKQGERAKEQKEHRVASATQNQEELKKPRGFREVQILVGRVLAWTSGLEMVLSGWDCGYSIWIGIYEVDVLPWSLVRGPTSDRVEYARGVLLVLSSESKYAWA